MITSAYVQLMARYNTEMNVRLYAAAGRLPEAARRADRGAFWHSIHGTFSHLLWADQMWMSRFAGWSAPEQTLAQSGDCYETFAAMAQTRVDTDRRLNAWAADLDDGWLAGDLAWFSQAAGREIRAPRPLMVVHLFNHQTHHRGQIHAMLTAAGEATGATDLPLVLEVTGPQPAG